ncbi:hypothetical protein ACRYCC_43820 [Actinomadura scrupuli]|uniref:hypothetical protein n=1 Tax=Actinomadura scrupuli TaxID=559629 RepID=UPI003D99E1A4
MTSESGWGPVPPSPAMSTGGDHVRPAPPAPTPPGRPGAPAGPPPPEPTGDERVDEAVARLAELGGAPVSRHVEIFEDVHRRLQDVLAAIDEDAPGPAAPAGPPVPRPPGPGGPSRPPAAGRPGGG